MKQASISDFGWKFWVSVIGFALVVVALKEYYEPAFFLLWNLWILLWGFVLGFTALSSKRPRLYGFLMLGFGIGSHAWEYHEAISEGACMASQEGGFLALIGSIDKCLNYSEYWVLNAQAAIIGGSVAVMAYYIWHLSEPSNRGR